MFIRQTKTSDARSKEAYFTFRLVASERVGNKVRQKTLLNLGRNFSLPREKWPQLAARIEQILSGQLTIAPAEPEIETLAQRYAARLVIKPQPAPTPDSDKKEIEYQQVDIDSLELTRPRSIGVEHVGLAALGWLELPRILEEAGLNGIQQAAVMGNVIGRMAAPGSERDTLRWLRERSGLGELLDVDFEAMQHMSLCRASDLLVRHWQTIEAAVFRRINDLFSLPETVTLYNLTNTFFEEEMPGNAKATHGHSKEKWRDCPLVALGLALDGSGFIRRSRMFEGNYGEASTLEDILMGLEAPSEALVIMEQGIATESNIAWLVEHKYRYLVVSREQKHQFAQDLAVAITTASEQTVRLWKVLSEDGTEVRLYCHSQEWQEKETAMLKRFAEKFESGLAKIAAGLTKPHGEKRRDQLQQRIERLNEKSHGIGQHYRINLSHDESGTLVTGLTWERIPVDGTQLTHPGVCCLRTNEFNWDEESLWRTYTMLTDMEAVFRSLKSESLFGNSPVARRSEVFEGKEGMKKGPEAELCSAEDLFSPLTQPSETVASRSRENSQTGSQSGMRPIYHSKEDRDDGHLFITVLAYQAVQSLRSKLKAKDIKASWASLREIFSVQQRVTATFKQRDGRTLHIRKTTVAEPQLQKLYDALDLTASPVGVRKHVN